MVGVSTATASLSLQPQRERLHPPPTAPAEIASTRSGPTDGILAGRDPAGSAGIARTGVAWLMRGHRWTILRAGCDTAMLVLASVLACLLTRSATVELAPLAFPPVTLALLYSHGRYRRRLRDSALDRIAPGIEAISLGSIAVFMLTILTVGNSLASSSLIAHVWVLSIGLLTAVGALLTWIETLASARRWVGTPTLIVGAGELGLDVAERLGRYPDCGLYVVGFVDSGRGAAGSDATALLGRLDDLAEIVAAHRVGHVVIALSRASQSEVERIVQGSQELGLATSVVPTAAAAINDRSHFDYLGSLPLLTVEAFDPTSLRLSVKYLLDRLVAAVLLLIVSPVLVAIALAVRVSSPGPVLFRQLRTGQDGRLFELLKFRTMRLGGDIHSFAPVDGLAPGGVEGVDRRTAIGRLLRRSSLDELPQLINVLTGSMSMIGPRPERPEFAEEFRRRFAGYRDRDRVRCGITGWAQVNGSRGQTPIADRVELDNFYIEHWSPGLDAKILLRTLPALLKGS
jgi:exopolysaccharide biosynthesis polyprenyl glycosylphosphotransferase